MPPPTQLPPGSAGAPVARRPTATAAAQQQRRRANTNNAAAAASAGLGGGGGSPGLKPVEMKVIVLGEANVGKSSLVRQFVHRTFDERLLSTVGCDFSHASFTVDCPVVRFELSRPPTGRGGAAIGRAGSGDVGSGAASSSTKSHSPLSAYTTNANHELQRSASGSGGGAGASPPPTPLNGTSPVIAGRARRSGPTVRQVYVDGGDGDDDDLHLGGGGGGSSISLGPDTRVSLASLQLWDTAGGERHNALAPMFFRGADACILVCDVTSAKSLRYLDHWADEFVKHCGGRVGNSSGGGGGGGNNGSGLPVMVVANKADVPKERQEITSADLDAFCCRRGFYRVAPLPEAHERALGHDQDDAPDAAVVHPAPSPAPEAAEEDDTNDAAAESRGVSASEPPAANNHQESAEGGDERAVSDPALPPAIDTTDAGTSSAAAAVEVAESSGAARSPPPPPTPPRVAAAASSPRRDGFSLFATATRYASAETVFATLAIEVVTRRAIAAARRESRNTSFAGNPSGDVEPAVPSHAVKLAKSGSTMSNRATAVTPGGSGGKQQGPKKRFKC